MSIELTRISKTFGAFEAVRDVSLSIRDGELMALLGPSGCGKTTLLRIIAGLEAADPSPESRLLLHRQDMAEVSARRRRVGFVFQHYALFRHMTIFDNIAFPLQVRPRRERPPREEIARRVHELLQLIQLDSLQGRYPAQLSGGQRQRVALARALAAEPSVLLLDEPFGALDAQVRDDLRRWLRGLHERLHITCVLVTHDQEEALEVADRIVVMKDGRIEQVGTPAEVYANPRTPFVMGFLGRVNIFHGRQPLAGTPSVEGTRILVRPHEFELTREPLRAGSVAATVRRVNAAGATVRLELASADGPLLVEITQDEQRRLQLAAGQPIYATPRQMTVFS